MRKKKPPIQAELPITDYSKKGNGLVETPYPAEIPFTMPGDVACATLTKKRRGVYQGTLDHIVHPSTDRISPRCSHFASCGGCRWQHVPYHLQLAQKQACVEQLFAPLKGVKTKIYPIMEAADQWHYRNKMEFTFSNDKAGNHYLGLMLNQGRGKVFNLTECHLCNPWFAKGVDIVRKWWKDSGLEAYYPPRDLGSLRTLTLREGIRTGDRMVILTVSGNPDYALNAVQLKSFVTALTDHITPSIPDGSLSLFLRIQQIAKGHETQIYEMHLIGPDHIRETMKIQAKPDAEPISMHFRISPSAFFQPNTLQAERFYSRALQLAQIPENGIVYDLYCGTGTLGACAAHFAADVIGIELSEDSVLDARENVKYNNLDNLTIYSGAVGKVLGTLAKERGEVKPDVVIVDPPRAGLDPDTIRHLSALLPETLVYISCNPSTQAENIAELLQKGYQIEAIQPVDQFPHTIHLENIVTLKYSN